MDRWRVVLFAFAAVVPFAGGDVVPVEAVLNTSWPYQTFKTANFTPPVVNHTRGVPALSSEGFLFFAPDGATEAQLAPIIASQEGDLIWNGPLTHAFNFGVQTYQGEQVLVYWNGSVFPEPVGRGNGAIYLLNNHYQEIAEVTLSGHFLELQPGTTFPSNIDLHEAFITDRNTIVVTANNVTQFDLTSVAGPADGWIVECFVYEIDIASNKILFEWRSLDHVDQIPLAAAAEIYPLGSEGFDGLTQSTAWGYFHINSASTFEDGFIVSSRFMCSAVAIAADGSVKWRLSGRSGGNFTLGDGANFCYQHDIRATSLGDGGVRLTMHDNANSPVENGTVPSSGKVLRLDLDSKHATLETRYWNASGPIFTTAQGNFQRLLDGNVFLGHGWVPIAEELLPDGQILSTWQFGAALRNGSSVKSPLKPTLSYRDFKQQWVGCPFTKPAVVAERSSDGMAIVYVSWNGATEVVEWQVYAGLSATSLGLAAHAAKQGFETAIEIGTAAYVQVTAILRNMRGAGGRQCACGQREVTSDIIPIK